MQSKADTLKKQVRENDILLNIHEKYSKKKSLFYSIKKKSNVPFGGGSLHIIVSIYYNIIRKNGRERRIRSGMDELKKRLQTIAELKLMKAPITEYLKELIEDYGVYKVEMKMAELGFMEILKKELTDMESYTGNWRTK